MTSLERIRTALDYKVADRIPTYDCYALGFTDSWRKYMHLPDSVIPEDYYSIDLRQCWVGYSPFLESKTIRETDTDLWVIDGFGREVHRRKGEEGEEYLSYLVKDPADIDSLHFDSANDERRYHDFEEAMREKKRDACPFASTLGLFMFAWYLRGEEDFLMDLAGDHDSCSALLERCAEFIGDVSVQAVKRGGAHECGFWFFDDMAMNTGPMLSPSAFETLIFPHYKRLIKRVKEAGAPKVMLHCDGNFECLLDMLIEAGFDVIQPVEPKAGMDIVKLRDRYAGRLALVGGMCNAHTLPNGPREKIRHETLRILDAAKEGGIVIGTHSIGADVPPENYDYYMNIVKGYGKSTR